MKPLRFISALILVISLGMSASGTLFAAGEEYKAKVTSDNYGERASWRLIHGVVNLAVSPAEIVMEPIHSVKEEKQNVGIGILEGVIYTAKFAALGAWDIITFWVPGSAGKDIAVQECVIEHLNRS